MSVDFRRTPTLGSSVARLAAVGLSPIDGCLPCPSAPLRSMTAVVSLRIPLAFQNAQVAFRRFYTFRQPEGSGFCSWSAPAVSCCRFLLPASPFSRALQWSSDLWSSTAFRGLRQLEDSDAGDRSVPGCTSNLNLRRRLPGPGSRPDLGGSWQGIRQHLPWGSVPFDELGALIVTVPVCLTGTFRSQGFSPSQRFHPSSALWLCFKPLPSMGFLLRPPELFRPVGRLAFRLVVLSCRWTTRPCVTGPQLSRSTAMPQPYSATSCATVAVGMASSPDSRAWLRRDVAVPDVRHAGPVAAPRACLPITSLRPNPDRYFY
jgi:hypothetical protein